MYSTIHTGVSKTKGYGLKKKKRKKKEIILQIRTQLNFRGLIQTNIYIYIYIYIYIMSSQSNEKRSRKTWLSLQYACVASLQSPI